MIQALRKHMAWRAVSVAGIAAAIVFFLTYVILSPGSLRVDGSLILRYAASLVLGSKALNESSTQVIVVGLLVHVVLSLIFTLIIAIVIHRWGLLVGIIGGALLGLALYFINLYTMTLFFNWFFAIKSGVLLISHVLFGAVAGGVYELLDRYDLPITGERKA